MTRTDVRRIEAAASEGLSCANFPFQFLIATQISRNDLNGPNINETCRSNRNKTRGVSVATDYALSLSSPQPLASRT
jgi:hypothetical protein